MDNIKAILFDADDTIVNHKECERQALLYLFAKIGIVYKDNYQRIFRPLDRSLWDGTYSAAVTNEDIPVYRFKRFFEIINIEYYDFVNANELFKKGLSEATALTENSEEIIKYLYNKGFMLCVVTNGLTSLQKPRIANSAIGTYISHIIVSEEVKAHKPNPLIFNTLLKNICIESVNSVMIGDSLEKDIKGAKNAGIKSIWYNPEYITNNTDILPDFEINDLLQIKKLFL